MKAYRELVELWDWLGFYLFMQRYDKASAVCGEIDAYKESHPIAYYLSWLFH